MATHIYVGTSVTLHVLKRNCNNAFWDCFYNQSGEQELLICKFLLQLNKHRNLKFYGRKQIILRLG